MINTINIHIICDEYELFTNDIYQSRACFYYGTSPILWKKAYEKYFNIDEIQTLNNRNETLFRPWKHIFPYRVMIKNQFPIVAIKLLV